MDDRTRCIFVIAWAASFLDLNPWLKVFQKKANTDVVSLSFSLFAQS